MLAPKRLAGLLAPSLYAYAEHAERITVARRDLELCLRAALARVVCEGCEAEDLAAVASTACARWTRWPTRAGTAGAPLRKVGRRPHNGCPSFVSGIGILALRWVASDLRHLPNGPSWGEQVSAQKRDSAHCQCPIHLTIHDQ